MAKFIEVTEPYKGKILINLETVMQVSSSEKGRTQIFVAEDDYIVVTESYDEIRKMVAVAQGGIPMSKCQTKEGEPG